MRGRGINCDFNGVIWGLDGVEERAQVAVK